MLTLAWSVLSSRAGDVVIVVDTSGSMLERVSKASRAVRIQTVQESLARYVAEMELGTRLYLLSFSTGIGSEQELILRSEADRAAASAWVGRLRGRVNASGTTHLWASLRKALQVATAYSGQNPDETVKVRVLTDGMDNDPKYRGVKPAQALTNLVREFPLLNDRSIRANLVLLGDLEMEMGSKNPLPGVWVSSRPTWTGLFPPSIQWTPAMVRVGDEVRFSYRSETSYAFADWWIDGQPVSRAATATHRFATAGDHQVRLKVTTTEGEGDDFVTETVPVIEVEKPQPLAPQISFVPSVPAPGEVVRLAGRANGANVSFEWFVDRQVLATGSEADWTPEREGNYEVRLVAKAPVDRIEETMRTISVVEPPIQVSFTAISSAASGQAVQFVNETEGRVADWRWDFGDGITSDERNPSHAFTNRTGADRVFSVVLAGTSPSGKVFRSPAHNLTVTPEITIPPPRAAFRILQESFQAGVSVAFVDESSGRIDEYRWDFGGEETSAEKNPTMTFHGPGEKAVRLTVTGPGGTDTTVRTVSVRDRMLQAAFNWLGTNGVAVDLPAALDFQTVHPAVLRRGDQLVTQPVEFELSVPREVPAASGVRLALDAEATNAFGIEQRVGEGFVPLVLPSLQSAPGRFRVVCRTNAPDGPHEGLLTVAAVGDRVLLNGEAGPRQVRLLLTVAKPPVPWGLILFIALVAAGVALGVWIKAAGQPPFPVDDPVLATLREIPPATEAPGAPAPRPPQEFEMMVGDFVKLGGSGRVFDLTKAGASIVRQAKGFVLDWGDGQSPQPLQAGKPVQFLDDQQRPRSLEALFRLRPDPGNPGPA